MVTEQIDNCIDNLEKLKKMFEEMGRDMTSIAREYKSTKTLEDDEYGSRLLED